VRFILYPVGAAGGAAVGLILLFVGAPWWSVPLSAAAALAVTWLVSAGLYGDSARLMAVLRVLRSLPLWDRLAMSAVLVISATAAYIGFRDLSIPAAFGLFLLPIVLAQVLFGTKCGFAAALASQVAMHYFVIPPRNSFAVQSIREVGLIFAFALLALVTAATLKLLSDLSHGKAGSRQPQS